ncbi:hypothetical protein QYM36_009754 [Artemia franciscana]|uniref:Uncharacterized protein n=1 Tax=Artemia franciscana TaxID=6661 RepID=A0AA88HUA1_ARTSF|nr:hypothetical protein QYM36_009754 [Artemia franciscana]
MLKVKVLKNKLVKKVFVDYIAIQNELSTTDWPNVLSGTVDEQWTKFKGVLLKAQDAHTKTSRPPGRKEDNFGSASPSHYDADQLGEKPSYYYEDVCGKTCILCCHGEKSQLGQGALLQQQATGPLLEATYSESQLQHVKKLDKLK